MVPMTRFNNFSNNGNSMKIIYGRSTGANERISDPNVSQTGYINTFGVESIGSNSMKRTSMNQRFGATKQPTGTPSLAWSCVVVVASLLAGASVVHNIYKPDLTLPPVENVDEAKKKQADNNNK
ncbi:hypothetical protein GQ457_14G005570 [Hibiscus cannabinus]